MLALGGFREGTLARLKYRHVKNDLEREVTPIHIHVEADITKGKYHDYYTFIGAEAAESLKLYLEMRKKGTEKIPPEEITVVWEQVHKLYRKAGLLTRVGASRYYLRAHSIRKYFRTQLQLSEYR